MPSLSEEALANSKNMKRLVMERLNLLKDHGVSISDVCKISKCHPRIILVEWIGANMRNNPRNILTEKHYIRFLNTIGIKITIGFASSPDSEIEDLAEKLKNEKERITTTTK
jgi:hypothetical protein